MRFAGGLDGIDGKMRIPRGCLNLGMTEKLSDHLLTLDAEVTNHLKPSAESQASTCPKASCCH